MAYQKLYMTDEWRQYFRAALTKVEGRHLDAIAGGIKFLERGYIIRPPLKLIEILTSSYTSIIDTQSFRNLCEAVNIGFIFPKATASSARYQATETCLKSESANNAYIPHSLKPLVVPHLYKF